MMDTHAAPRSPPWQVVLNSAAGDHDDEGVLEALQQGFAADGEPYALHRPRGGEPLEAVARRAVAAAVASAPLQPESTAPHPTAPPRGRVVAVGGDGTVNTVAAAALGQPVALGVLARGTFNYVARAHGLPLDPADAVRALRAGQAQRVPVGRVNGRPFLVNASLGLYPQLLRDREAFKARFGRHRTVALIAALRTLARRPPRLSLRVEADGRSPQSLQVGTLFIGNNALQLQDLGLPEAERVGLGPVLDEGPVGSEGPAAVLAALALRPLGVADGLGLALRGLLGRWDGAPGLRHFGFRELTVQPLRPPRRPRPLAVALDGEVGQLLPPLRFEVDERSLWMVLPPAAAASPAAPARPAGAYGHTTA